MFQATTAGADFSAAAHGICSLHSRQKYRQSRECNDKSAWVQIFCK